MGLLDRRNVVKGAAVAMAVAAVPAIGRNIQRKPNFLFIMADDMGVADLSCYGRREYRTPSIDGLANEGIRFTSAYANSAVCTATRVALATGRYQYRLPIGLEEPLALRDVGLPPDQPTIASVLREQGYATSLIGKWHLGNLPKYGPLQSGYDEFWGLRSGGVDYYTHKIAGKPDLWDGDTPIEEVGYLTDLLGDHAISAIERNSKGSKPWLMSLHFTAPHWPWEAPGDTAESTRLDAIKEPTGLMHYDGGSMGTYSRMVTRLDYQVGRVLAALRRTGQDRNTVVVFTSDNGGERFADTWPFTGRKTELLEGGIRIPAIVRWPGLSHAGTTNDAPIMSMDWLPTFLAAAGGVPIGGHPFDGVDVRNAIAGGGLAPRSLFWRYKNHAQEAIRRGNFKYLKIAGSSFLFDVVADPMERANLKNRRPEEFAALKSEWDHWNATMLPLDPQSQTHGFTGAELADHFGVDD